MLHYDGNKQKKEILRCDIIITDVHLLSSVHEVIIQSLIDAVYADGFNVKSLVQTPRSYQGG